MDEADYELMFPSGNDVEFIEDFVTRAGEDVAKRISKETWRNQVNKKDVKGIHGTLFYHYAATKKKFYPNKKFSDDPYGRSQ